MLDVVYIQISIPCWYGYNPTVHLYRCQSTVLYLFSWMIYAIHYPLLSLEYSVYCCYRMLNHQTLCNKQVSHCRYPFFHICSRHGLLQSPVVKRTSTRYCYKTTGSSASLWLYLQQSMLRKICNALLESNLNHIRTIKHLRIMVGEYIHMVYLVFLV